MISDEALNINLNGLLPCLSHLFFVKIALEQFPTYLTKKISLWINGDNNSQPLAEAYIGLTHEVAEIRIIADTPEQVRWSNQLRYGGEDFKI